jgi:hypothetical protein
VLPGGLPDVIEENRLGHVKRLDTPAVKCQSV